MVTARTPLYLSHAPTPTVQHFALLAALEAAVRGTLLSVMPIALYKSLGSAELVSQIYFLIGIGSLITGLLIPWISRFIPRRWMTTIGGGFYLAGCGLGALGQAHLYPIAVMLNALGTVTFTICLSAYVLDYITRSDLGKNETMRLVYSAVPWATGPVLGVWMFSLWPPLPFLSGIGFTLVYLATFWRLRLGNGKQITRARGPAANPLAFLGRFFAQPRLVAGWLFAVIRSCGWWVYIVYLPIFCIENGLGEATGAIATSGANALLFLSPLMLRVVGWAGVRGAVRGSFALGAVLLIGASLLATWPWTAFSAVAISAVVLVMLDVCGSLPFLMAVKPSERTEMVAVYASFRDVSGITTPAVAWAILLVAPVQAVFGAAGLAMGAAWMLAGRLHPRLGAAKVPRPVQAIVTVD